MTTQSEQVLEDDLVAQLTAMGYAKVDVTDEASMLANLKAQLEAFNSLKMTAGEFNKVLNHLGKSAGVFAKAKILRDRMKLEKEDWQTVYVEFFDSVNPSRNHYHVTQQVAIEGSYKNRYDVTILINGLPLAERNKGGTQGNAIRGHSTLQNKHNVPFSDSTNAPSRAVEVREILEKLF